MIKYSILILTHDAPHYVEETITTLNEITDKNDLFSSEIIVLDNDSNKETKDLLFKLKLKNYIHKLKFSEINTFFAKGNNIASELADHNSEFYILLNSDVRIKNKNWIKYMLKVKNDYNCVAVSFGFAANPDRCDGYCFLIDKEYYNKYKLDEEYEWGWSLTKLEANLLKDGLNLCAVKFHDKYLHHYGGGSGKDFLLAKSKDTSFKTILSWFSNNSTGRVYIKNKYIGFSINRVIKKVRLKFSK